MVPNSRKKESTIEFNVVYRNYQGKYRKRYVGTVSSFEKGKYDYVTLSKINFRIGDLIDINVRY